MSIRLRNVSFTYPESAAPALRGIDFDALPGQVTLVTGCLGAGASTLIQVIAGLAPRHTSGQREGEVQVLGHDPMTAAGHDALAGRMATVLPSVDAQLSGMAFTVWDEVAFGPANLGWPRDRVGAAVDAALVEMGVEHLARRDPQSLSGGELQRVIVAGCLAMEPDVLLLDEPAHELDPSGAEGLYGCLPALAAGTAVVLATTDVERAASVADRAVVLHQGTMVASGVPNEALCTREAVLANAGLLLPTLFHAAGFPDSLPADLVQARRCLGQ
jgi:energy-coupling factor transporter ATP-binding protein EcfA2